MSDLDSDAEAQAMAAAMGFSSFGAAPATKKRKFNPVTDSFVDGDGLKKLDRGGKKGTGSGGNTVPLGKQRVIGQKQQKPVKNEDEIQLDLSDDDIPIEREKQMPSRSEAVDPRLKIRRSVSPRREESEDGPAYMDTSEAAPAEARNGYSHNESDRAQPAQQQNNLEAQEMQAKIDSILDSIQPPPGSFAPARPAQSHPQSLSTFMQSVNTLPARPVSSSTFPKNHQIHGHGRDRFSDTASVASNSTHGRSRGEHNPTWYIEYYDPNFNENPWARLEQSLGLESVGTWVSRA